MIWVLPDRGLIGSINSGQPRTHSTLPPSIGPCGHMECGGPERHGSREPFFQPVRHYTMGVYKSGGVAPLIVILSEPSQES